MMAIKFYGGFFRGNGFTIGDFNDIEWLISQGCIITDIRGIIA